MAVTEQKGVIPLYALFIQPKRLKKTGLFMKIYAKLIDIRAC
jgi:hypothetical protein